MIVTQFYSIIPRGACTYDPNEKIEGVADKVQTKTKLVTMRSGAIITIRVVSLIYIRPPRFAEHCNSGSIGSCMPSPPMHLVCTGRASLDTAFVSSALTN